MHIQERLGELKREARDYYDMIQWRALAFVLLCFASLCILMGFCFQIGYSLGERAMWFP